MRVACMMARLQSPARVAAIVVPMTARWAEEDARTMSPVTQAYRGWVEVTP